MYKLITLLLFIFILFSCKKKEGCTDPLAQNFDAEACKDNGSCIYTIKDSSLAQKMAGIYQFSDSTFDYFENGILNFLNVKNYELEMKYENDSIVSITNLSDCSGTLYFLVQKDTLGLYNPDQLCYDFHTVEIKHLSFKPDTFYIIYRKNYQSTEFYDIVHIKGVKIE